MLVDTVADVNSFASVVCKGAFFVVVLSCLSVTINVQCNDKQQDEDLLSRAQFISLILYFIT